LNGSFPKDRQTFIVLVLKLTEPTAKGKDFAGRHGYQTFHSCKISLCSRLILSPLLYLLGYARCERGEQQIHIKKEERRMKERS
jgi:hypothetical protein